MLSEKPIGKNIIWNLTGSLAPLLVAAIAVPFIISNLGIERFGVLTIIWALIGYFSFFDMGLGQAITKRVAEGLGRDKPHELVSAIWAALGLMSILGIAACIFLLLISPWLLQDLLKIPEQLQKETTTVFLMVALSLPIIVTTAGLRGVLEACQQFRWINIVRIPMGIFVFLSPLLVIPFSVSLTPLVFILILGRLFGWLIYLYFVLRAIPELKQNISVNRSEIKPLVSFGGWMTVSNVTLPFMIYIDRFVIGTLMSLGSVTYYVIPHEVVTRIRIIPSAFMGVVFPAFARSLVGARERVVKLFIQSQEAVFLSVFPLVLLVSIFAAEGLNIWLGNEFAIQSTVVVYWLAAGVLVNALGSIPLILIRALGRPDLPAKIYLIELPIFFLSLLLLVKNFGINGAAFGYFLRWVIDTSAMLFFVVRLMPETLSYAVRSAVLLFSGLAVLFGVTLVEGFVLKIVIVTLILLGLVIVFRQSITHWKAQIL